MLDVAACNSKPLQTSICPANTTGSCATILCDAHATASMLVSKRVQNIICGIGQAEATKTAAAAVSRLNHQHSFDRSVGVDRQASLQLFPGSRSSSPVQHWFKLEKNLKEKCILMSAHPPVMSHQGRNDVIVFKMRMPFGQP